MVVAEKRMRVCIVGSGVAGLQCAKIMTEYGHKCTIFDKTDGPGGVWSHNYDGYSLQVPSELYEFIGLSIKEQDGTFPDGKQVQEYIESYMRKHGLVHSCDFHFCEAVIKIDQVNEEWCIETTKQSYSFDYCVIATGMYNNPYIPAQFKSYNTIHTSCFTDARIAQNKNVVVVGGGKSAIDCAVAASKHARKVSIVTRELHWPVPRYILGCIPFKWGTYSRLGHFLLPKHWNLTDKEIAWHERLRSIKSLAWRFLESIFAFQFNLKVRPTIPLEIDLFNGGQILTYELRDGLQNHSIEYVEMSDTVMEEADVVIVGTGFQKTYDLFAEGVRQRLDICTDGLWLYRNIIPVGVKRLAFIGSEISTFNNILTHNLQSQWLAHNLECDTLPNATTMNEDIEKERTWKRSWMADTPSRASLLQLHMTKYHDILMHDCNRSLVKNKWYQWVLPITARDYN